MCIFWRTKSSRYPKNGLPGGSVVKICLQCRSRGRCGFNLWIRKILWRRTWQPTPVFLSGESHEQRSLVGYSPRGHKKTQLRRLITYLHTLKTALTDMFWRLKDQFFEKVTFYCACEVLSMGCYVSVKTMLS